MQLATLDLAIIGLYAVMIIAIAQWVSREKAGHQKDAKDYFLAGKNLPWWAIGASLIAANISAEQIIGMSGSGFALGLGIASYEWMAAITLIIVGKYFLPIFLKEGIYSMPQYLEKRYDHRVRMVMAVFWIGLYVFVNLAAILWLGALAMNQIAGVDLVQAIIILGTLATAYSLYGGLKAVALTDIIQVVLLVMGGIFVTWLALDQISGGNGPLEGFKVMTDSMPERFDMILSSDNEFYNDLPGISVLVGGLWIMNISYWGCNQYIIQRALAAKSTREAQKGIMLAAGLKLLMPIFVVLPGIAAAVMLKNEMGIIDADMAVKMLGTAEVAGRPDLAYPAMMGLLPEGIQGLVFAALIAAILSSLGSMMNSISTIFTMDIYRHFKPDTDDVKLVKIGRIVAVCSIIIAMLIAKPLLGNFPQAFQFIQNFTGFFTPGIVVLFILGLFWKRTTANAALTAAIGSFVLSAIGYQFFPDYPFMDRVGVVFLLCTAIAVGISLMSKPPENVKAVDIGEIDFSTTKSFNVATGATILVLIALYTTWW